MRYYARLVSIRLMRVLFHYGAKLVTPKGLTPVPKPRRTVHVVRSPSSSSSKGRKSEKVRCDIYLPSSYDDDGQDRGANGTREPSTASAAAATSAKLPVIVNLHGSGFTMLMMGDDARFCQWIADAVPCVVVDTDYAKAPEQPYPAPAKDIDAVLDWLINEQSAVQAGSPSHDHAFHPASKDVNVEQLAVTGFSAGGNLALTTCVRARKRDVLDRIKAVVAFYPSTNLNESPYDKPQLKPVKGASGGVLPPIVRSIFYDAYLPPERIVVKQQSSSDGRSDSNEDDDDDDDEQPSTARGSPFISPLYAAADSFPPSVTIVTCSADSLSREGRQFAEHIVAQRSSDDQRTAYAQQDAKSKCAKCDPPVDVPDVDRIALPENEERQGVVWWSAPGQGHAWDKMVKPGSDPERLRDEAYDLTVRRLQRAFAAAAVAT